MSKNRVMRSAAGMLLTAALSMLTAVQVFAATGKINFSDPSVTVGSEVNVTMKITAEEGAKLSNANVTLKYPAEQLEFISGTDADGGAGIVRVHGATNGAGSSVLEYNLKFKTIAAGEFGISIETYEVYDDADQPLEMTHLGSSAVKVSAEETASKEAGLQTLEISPGSLTPAFSTETTEYQVSVGMSVESLVINAHAVDGGANVTVLGNESLSEGENTVTVQVTAADGETKKDYVLHVTKAEGGAENTQGSGETPAEPLPAEGVQLSSKGKTITIMNPTSDVEIPEGFRSGTISIDGQRVQGWVWGADTNPQYCVVYGMNDQGELNFYRYDMAEKTIQRYFEDPLSADAVSNQEYSLLKTSMEELERGSEVRFLIICCLALISVVLLGVVVYLSSKIRNMGRSQKRTKDLRRKTSFDDFEELSMDESLLRHDFEAEEAETEESAMDETQVIRRSPERRKRQRPSGDTMRISPVRTDEEAEASGEEKEEATAEKRRAASLEESAEDDAFETFDL